MTLRYRKCPICLEQQYYFHDTVYRWNPSLGKVGPMNGKPNPRITRRFYRRHLQACQDRQVIEHYGELSPLAKWSKTRTS